MIWLSIYSKDDIWCAATLQMSMNLWNMAIFIGERFPLLWGAANDITKICIAYWNYIRHTTVYCCFQTDDITPYFALLIHAVQLSHPVLIIFYACGILVLCSTTPQYFPSINCYIFEGSTDYPYPIQIMTILVMSLLYL